MSIETNIINKIRDHFKDKYNFDENGKLISVYTRQRQFIIKLNYNFNVHVTVVSEYPYRDEGSVVFKLVLLHGYSSQEVYGNISNDEYLNEFEKCIDDLIDQIHIYEEFIKGFVDSVVDDLYNVEYHINLNTLHTYFKSYNGRAVIYPALELGHKGRYVTMYIDSIEGGKYPMKMYSSISYDDAKDMLNFYL